MLSTLEEIHVFDEKNTKGTCDRNGQITGDRIYFEQLESRLQSLVSHLKTDSSWEKGMLFFGKKRKKEQEIDEAFAKVYQEIETIDNWNDPKKLEHYILDSCEQIIALTKEIEEEKAENTVLSLPI